MILEEVENLIQSKKEEEKKEISVQPNEEDDETEAIESANLNKIHSMETPSHYTDIQVINEDQYLQPYESYIRIRVTSMNTYILTLGG